MKFIFFPGRPFEFFFFFFFFLDKGLPVQNFFFLDFLRPPSQIINGRALTRYNDLLPVFIRMSNPAVPNDPNLCICIVELREPLHSEEDIDVVSLDAMTDHSTRNHPSSHLDVKQGATNNSRPSYRDVTIGALQNRTLDSGSAAMETALRIDNLRSGRNFGAFRAWESPNRATINLDNQPTSTVGENLNAGGVVSVTTSVDRSSPYHLPIIQPRHPEHGCHSGNKSNKSSKKRSSSHLSPNHRDNRLASASPQPSTSGHIPNPAPDHASSHIEAYQAFQPLQDTSAKGSNNVSAAAAASAYNPSVPYTRGETESSDSSSDVDVLSLPSPVDCYTPTDDTAHSSATAGLHQHSFRARSKARHGKKATHRKHTSDVRTKNEFFPFHKQSNPGSGHRSPNMLRHLPLDSPTDPGFSFIPGAEEAHTADLLTSAAERELYASEGFPAALQPGFSSHRRDTLPAHRPARDVLAIESNSDDSDIEVVRIETKKPRLRNGRHRRSATVVVDLTESDGEAGPSATESRPPPYLDIDSYADLNLGDITEYNSITDGADTGRSSSIQQLDLPSASSASVSRLPFHRLAPHEYPPIEDFRSATSTIPRPTSRPSSTCQHAEAADPDVICTEPSATVSLILM